MCPESLKCVTISVRIRLKILGSVMVDPDVKLLCCASNILFVAFAVKYMYNIARFA